MSSFCREADTVGTRGCIYLYFSESYVKDTFNSVCASDIKINHICGNVTVYLLWIIVVQINDFVNCCIKGYIMHPNNKNVNRFVDLELQYMNTFMS